jgi:membrane associated rhomboid family serine protease/ribosomal protein L40E
MPEPTFSQHTTSGVRVLVACCFCSLEEKVINMYIQTCWQCGAKNQINEEVGQGGKPVCEQCGAELPTVAASQSEKSWPERNDFGRAGNRSTSALVQQVSNVSISYVLIAINVIVFILMVLSDVHLFEPTTESIYRWGADFGPASLGAEPWRLLSSMFVHIGIIHLALNMYVLSDIGPLIERLFGKMGFLALYLLSGIGGNLLSIYWSPATVSAGASGGIFGLFGGLLGLLLTQRSSFPSDFVQQHITSIIGFLAFNLFYGMTITGINNAAHMGGLATGFILVLALKPDLTGRRPRWKVRQFAGIIVVLLALGFAGFAAKRRVDGSREARLLSIIYSPAKVIVQPGKEIYFLNQATRDEAQSLAQSLQARDWFKDAGDRDIFLSKDSQGFEISFPVRDEAFADPKVSKHYEAVATDISVDTFNKKPVAIHLCNELLVPRITVKSGSKITIGPKKEIYFRGEVTENEAQSLSQALQEMKFGEGAEGAYIELSKNSQGYEILFMVKDGIWDQPERVAWYERLAAVLSVTIFHQQPVTIHLSDGQFTIKKSIKN